ncbi:MAG TPA: dTMP kinase [Vicinamibacteria bacterium]|nr:dTMP kinase [Vicinamibacteria bacterium]
MAFLTFEGIEGCGKSTQAQRLCARLSRDPLLTCEPGGTALGRSIRELLLEPARGAMSPVSEALLYLADRAQHVAEVIRPALENGRTVVSDRYVDSTLAYQGYGRGLPMDLLLAVAELATGGLRPDLTLFLDVPVELGLQRVGKRGRHDRLESERIEFHERVRRGYLELIEREPRRWTLVDGQGTEDEVAARVDAAVARSGVLGG